MAQERMATNQVMVFPKKQPSKYTWVAEIRSQAENSNKPAQQMTLMMKSKYKGGDKGKSGQQTSNKFGQSIYVNIPMLKEPVPLAMLFRALNCTTDKQILAKVCFDSLDDIEMYEALRPSLEEAKMYDQQEDALDYIAKRGNA